MAKKPNKLGWPLIGRYLCHQCMGAFSDGRQDCQVTWCPLYSKMPYRKLEPTPSFLEYNPKKNGFVDWEGNTLGGNTATGFKVIAAATQQPVDNEEIDWDNEDWSVDDEPEDEINNAPIVWE